MTTYSATPSDNLQAKINALLPGDTLLVGGGTYTYSALTVGVSGSPANEIKIIGSLNVNGTHDVLLTTGSVGTGSQALKVTGSYLHIENFDIWQSPRGVVVDNASHVKLRNISMIYCANEGVWIHNNAHNIFLWDFSVGSTDLPANNFTIGFRIGTPNASWTNANTPDRTNNIHLYTCRSDWNPGWGVQVCEGAHHILIEDHMFDSSSGPDNRPPAGSANGDGGYNSRGDYVQFLRCFIVAPTVNYFRLDKITVGGVTYGLHQEIKGGGGRPFGIADPNNYDPNAYFAAVQSNTDDLKVYRIFFNVYQVVFPGYDVSVGTWPAKGWLLRADLFKKLDIGGPARAYRLPNETLPYGQINPWVDLNWTAAPVIDAPSVPDVNPQTYGQEFVVDRPGGWLVGFTYWRSATFVKPSVARLYHLEVLPDDVTLAALAPAPEVSDFASYEEWSIAFQAYSEFQGAYTTSDGTFADFYHRRAIVPTTKTFATQGTIVKQGWVYEYLATPYPLIENYHYCAGFYMPQNTSLQGAQGWTMGLLFPDMWGRSWGANGFRQGPVVLPTVGRTAQIAGDASVSGFDNRRGNIVTRQIGTNPTRINLYNFPLVGEQISYPDIGVLLSGDAIAIGPIVSFARVIPEEITVTPDMDLQAIFNTRIPGDTVIISGTHIGEYTLNQSGSLTKPIHVKGDGTGKLRYTFGPESALPALRVKASYQWIENLIFENGRNGVCIENAVTGIRVETCTARFVRDEGFVVQEDSSDVCFISCTANDTGLGKIWGDGFRVGRHAGYWLADDHPDVTERVLIQGCTVFRNYGTGISACDGATKVVVKTCAVDFTQGNTPPTENVDWPVGYFSRADTIQFIGCTVLGAPGAGFLIMDSEWYPNTGDYGRLQEVKGGSATTHHDAGVTSQSEGLKVYADFTATPLPRLREIEGGWSAAGGSVATTLFRELVFDSISQHYPPNETE